MDQTGAPDLTGAETYVEADHPIAGGRWHILPDDEDTVIYQRPNGTYGPSIISAHTLRGRPTWIPALAES